MRKATNKLFLIYYTIYVIAVLEAVLVVFWKTDAPCVAERSELGVNLMTFYIIFLLVTIPLALKLFNVKVKSLASVREPKEKISRYTKYAILRLLVIGLSLLLGIFLFYMLNSVSMMFCAGIAAIALVFCKPSEMKMAADLETFDDAEDDED